MNPELTLDDMVCTNRPPELVASQTVSVNTALLVLRLKGRPPTANLHRSKHWRQAQADTAAWREQACWLTRAAQTLRPPADLLPVRIHAQPHYPNRRSWPDTGACWPAVKAALDGICDAGWLADDRPEYVGPITLWPPALATKEEPGLLIWIEPS